MAEDFTYISACSGMEAATVAWHPLGWVPVAFAEIDKFPSAVLRHHHPNVPNWGDITKFQEWPDADIDVLVGGTPCQSFSVAGLRRGLTDPRGNLMLTYLAILDKYRPTWMVWENVPGVLSSNKGRDFGSFLGALGELGYGWAYRSLDAQYFHLAQRRERVFVVGCLRGWASAAQVLFEPEGLSGYPPPSREAGKGLAPTLSARTKGGGGLGTDFDCDGGLVAATLDASYYRLQGCSGQDANHGHSHLVAFGGNNTSGPIDVAFACNARGGAGRMDFETETLIAHSLRGDGFDASEDGTGRGIPLVVTPPFTGSPYGDNSSREELLVAIQERAICENPSAGPDGAGFRQDGLAYTLEARSVPQAVAFDTTQITSRTNRCNPQVGDPCHPIAAEGHPPAVAFRTAGDGCAYEEGETVAPLTTGTDRQSNVLATRWAVRRLTPVECCRLQGFPDDYLDIPYRGKLAADGPKYKALGNSMAVPVMRWIGERIAAVEKS